MEYKTPMAKQRTKKQKKQMKEGKVIKIMSRQWGRTGWCCAALFQRCARSSSQLRLRLLTSLAHRGARPPEAAGGSLSLLSNLNSQKSSFEIRVQRVNAGHPRLVADLLLSATSTVRNMHAVRRRRRHGRSQQFPAGNQNTDNLFCHTLISASLALFSVTPFLLSSSSSSSTQKQHL